MYRDNKIYNYTMIVLWLLMLIINCIAIYECYKQEKIEKRVSVEELIKYCPNIEEKLEEYMGGDITFTEEGQVWIDSICEVNR